jgi:hypothetical protein
MRVCQRHLSPSPTPCCGNTVCPCQNSVPGRDALTVLPSLEDLCVLLTKTEAGPDRTPTAWPTTGALARKMVAATVDSSSAPGVASTK